MKRKMVVLTILLVSCSTTSKNDPLAYSKKLIKEGHISLYKNGAFEVPGTTLTLIPAGPRPYELAIELIVVRAKASFQLSLKRARESVYIVKEGTRWSYHKGKVINQDTDKVIDTIKSFSRPGSKVVMEKSAAMSVGLLGSSWQASKRVKKKLKFIANQIEESSKAYSEQQNSIFAEHRQDVKTKTAQSSEEVLLEGKRLAKKNVQFAYESFVLGNLAIPTRLKENVHAVSESPSLKNFINDYHSTEEVREEYSSKMIYLIGETIEEYSQKVKNTFAKGNAEINEHTGDYGYSFATLRALRYYLQGVLWDGVVVPTGKISGAALGYVTVNAVAYPALLTISEGGNLTELAIEVAFNSGKSVFDITAPTVGGAVAGALSLLSSGGGSLASLAVEGGGKLYEGAVVGAQVVTISAMKNGGQVAAQGTRYIGVPLAVAGITTAGALSGVAVGTAGLVASGGTYVGGEALQAGSFIVGKSAAVGTVVVGSTISLVTGAIVTVYEMGEAIVVPSTYTLGSGLVLSYGTLGHLGAQTLLAVSDASYIVLSLEGPRWVLYAVKGELGKNEDLSSGTVLDLEKMKKNGEIFYQVPASDIEMKEVIKSLEKNL